MDLRTSEGSDSSGADDHPTSRGPLLTEADVRLLAQAIREGNAERPPSRGDLAFDAVQLLAVLGFLAASWVALHWWHPEVAASYDGGVTSTLSRLSMDASPGDVRWSVPGVYARSIQLSGPANRAGGVVLPVACAECPVLATKLGLLCDHGALVERASIAVVWSMPQLFYLAPATSGPPGLAGLDRGSGLLDVDISRSTKTGAPVGTNATGTPAPNASVSFNLSGAGPINWCTAAPAPGTTLTLHSGNQSVGVPVDQVSGTSCAQGLALVVQAIPLGGPGRPPATVFGGVTALKLEATSTNVDASDLGGTLHLGAAGTDALAPPTEVTLASRPADGVHLVLDLAGDNTELAMTSAKLASASTSGTNLVSSWWDRESSIALPLFLAICAIALNLVFPFLDDVRKRRAGSRDAVVKP